MSARIVRFVPMPRLSGPAASEGTRSVPAASTVLAFRHPAGRRPDTARQVEVDAVEPAGSRAIYHGA